MVNIEICQLDHYEPPLGSADGIPKLGPCNYFVVLPG